MAGLRSTYSYEKSTNERSVEMLKTRQVPMDVNAMPGLVSDKSADESREIEGQINAMQGGDACFFCKQNSHMKKDCRKYEDWKKKNPNRRTGSSYGKPISCYICEKDRHISRECKSERRNAGHRDAGDAGGRQMAEISKSLAAIQEVIRKLALDTVFL